VTERRMPNLKGEHRVAIISFLPGLGGGDKIRFFEGDKRQESESKDRHEKQWYSAKWTRRTGRHKWDCGSNVPQRGFKARATSGTAK